jgi:hypothetical protein
MKVLNPDNIGAEFFVDAEMNPKELELTIESVTSEKPPAGKKEKACFYFKEIPSKKCFLANTQVKLIARKLRKADTKDWIGSKVVITCAEKTYSGKPVMGMIVKRINGMEA